MTTLIPKYEFPSSSVNRPINEKLAEIISVKDFGAVGDGVTDDTTAIQNAFNSISSADNLHGQHATIYFPSGIYLVSTLQVNYPNLEIVSNNATILGKTTGTYDALINVSPTANIAGFTTITGNLTLNCQYNAGYTTALLIKSGYGRFENINVLRSALAVKIGGTGANDVSQSEMAFSKIYTNECLRCVEINGLFAVGIFNDCVLVGGETTNWPTGSYDTTVIKIVGGRGYFKGGEFSGSASGTYPIFSVNQALYDGTNFTGNLYVEQADIECPRQLLAVWNNDTVVTANIGTVIITNSRIDGYYSQITGTKPDFIFTNNDYTGRLIINSNRIWFDVPLSARPVTIGANTQAQINWEDFIKNGGYYGTNWANYPGLPPQVPFQIGLSVVMTNAFTATDNTPVKFDTVQTGLNAQRLPLSGYYNTTTGKLTVPNGGLSSILIVANYTFSSGLGTFPAPQVWIEHYSPSVGFTRQLSQCDILTPNGQIVCMIPEAVAGDTISFITYPSSAGGVLDVSNPYNNQMTISAYITTPNS